MRDESDGSDRAADGDGQSRGDGSSEPADRSSENESPDDDHADAETVTLEEVLRSNDVLEPTADETDLRLSPEFARAWHHRIERLRDGDRTKRWLAAANDVDSGAVAFDESGEHFAVTVDDSPYGEWPSRAAFVADLVAEPTLKEWIPAERLDELPTQHRTELSARLLMFLETCPSCDGSLAFTEDTSAVGDAVQVTLDCTACGAPIARGSYDE